MSRLEPHAPQLAQVDARPIQPRLQTGSVTGGESAALNETRVGARGQTAV